MSGKLAIVPFKMFWHWPYNNVVPGKAFGNWDGIGHGNGRITSRYPALTLDMDVLLA